MYPSTSLFVAIGQLVIVILVLFSYPLQVHPCRNCLDKVFHAGQPVVASAPVALLDDEPELDDDHSAGEMSTVKHAAITTAVVALGFTTAFFVSDLQLGNDNRRFLFSAEC